MEILKKSHTVVLDPREGEYCWRKRATLQARVERVFLLKMLEQGYQTELLKKIDESLLAKVEPLEPPPLLAYLDAHLNEERYYEEWQKIFFEMGHIYNKEDRHQGRWTRREIVAKLYLRTSMVAAIWIRSTEKARNKWRTAK